MTQPAPVVTTRPEEPTRASSIRHGAALIAMLFAISCGRDGRDERGVAGERDIVTVTDASGRSVRIADSSRLVTVGGGVTEIVFALGAGSRVVGVDTSSIFPDSATALPKVGYQRQLSAEGVVSLRPTLVLASADAGPPAAVEQLRSSGVALLTVTGEHTIHGARARIRVVARALHLEEQGKKLEEALDGELAEGRVRAAAARQRPKVLFIYARGQGTLNVSGRATAADEMIRLAGGVNAFGEFEGYKPLTAEGAVSAAPEVILLPSRGIESLGGIDAVLGLPGLSLTPAGRSRRIVVMDDLLLLGFGPRTGHAVRELAALLHTEGRGSPLQAGAEHGRRE
jgi:iron complex transport system substrate-binding protein